MLPSSNKDLAKDLTRFPVFKFRLDVLHPTTTNLFERKVFRYADFLENELNLIYRVVFSI